MKTFAHIISIIFHPVFISLYCSIIFVNSLPFSLWYPSSYKFFLVISIAIFTCIIPIFYMLLKYLGGSISDINVSDREKRQPFYLVSFFCYVICGIFLVWQRVEPFFLLIFISALFSVPVLAAVNFRWKISAHGCGAGVFCGAVFASAYYLESNPILLFCGVILVSGAVMFSRLLLGVHTFAQVVAGFFAGLLFSTFPIWFL
jgi:membrane-associated phospholipid phosphatase